MIAALDPPPPTALFPMTAPAADRETVTQTVGGGGTQTTRWLTMTGGLLCTRTPTTATAGGGSCLILVVVVVTYSVLVGTNRQHPITTLQCLASINEQR